MSLPKYLKNLVGTKNEIITAKVTATGTGTATVQRAGQTSSTKHLPVAYGLAVYVNDWVEVVMLNGDINTGVITRRIR